MMEKLEQLRKKPVHIKRMIAAGTAGGISLVIVLFWIVSLSVTTTGPAAEEDQASAQIAASPFTALSASVYDAFAPMAGTFQHLKDIIDGTPASSSNAIQIYSASQVQNGQQANMNMNTINQ
jgi:hypothetical protein